jgi:hypothetical protein
MSVKRYSPTYQCPEDWSDDSAMVACDDGLYVLATDYDAEVDRLKADAERYRHLWDTHFGRFYSGYGDDYCIREDVQESIDKAIATATSSRTTEGGRS